MDPTITICGWILFGAISLAAALFILGCLWAAAYLGYLISTRYIRERKGWKRAIRQGNYKITRHAALVMRDRLGYGKDATLQEIIRDINTKLTNTTK